ncbi:MAG TPA: STAS/SEC14 domain-containing protein [Candidatus Babeliaceae bacterium]|nr:STAS/SEC14 domain-containing protein [Candidatus Babeliaceae bacterium]
MLQQITDLPPTVVGFRATGKVTSQDYETVLLPAVDKQVKETDKLNYLFVLDTDISDFNIGALMDDAKAGIKYYGKWHKIAIVSDQNGVNKFTDIFGHLLPGQTRSFTLSQLDEAKKWVAS